MALPDRAQINVFNVLILNSVKKLTFFTPGRSHRLEITDSDFDLQCT